MDVIELFKFLQKAEKKKNIVNHAEIYKNVLFLIKETGRINYCVFSHLGGISTGEISRGL